METNCAFMFKNLLQLWDNFSAIKHTIRGCYHAHWKISLGKNGDDAILLCILHHWAEKRNKVIRATNKKRAQMNPPGDLRPVETASCKEESDNWNERKRRL